MPLAAKWPKIQRVNKPEQADFSTQAESGRGCALAFRCLYFTLWTLALLGIVIIYASIGGAIFSWLEMSQEQSTKVAANLKAKAIQLKYATEVYKAVEIAEKNNAEGQLDSAAILAQIEESMEHFSVEMYKLIKTGDWGGRVDSTVESDWSFTGGLLFSITTITLIGFGSVTPKTLNGQIVTIFYSVFGIPITIVCISHVGFWLAHQVRIFHKRLSARCRKSTSAQVKEVPVLFSLLTMVFYVLGGATIFSLWEGWLFSDGAYFSFVTLTTIGYGDLVPGIYKGSSRDFEAARGNSDAQLRLAVCGFYLFFGLALLAMCMDLMKEEVRANFRWLGHKLNSKRGSIQQPDT